MASVSIQTAAPGFPSLTSGASGSVKEGMHKPAHLEVIEHHTCAEHIVLQGHKVWKAGVNDHPSPPPVDVHSVMLHEGLPLIPLPGPVFSQLVYLHR